MATTHHLIEIYGEGALIARTHPTSQGGHEILRPSHWILKLGILFAMR